MAMSTNKWQPFDLQDSPHLFAQLGRAWVWACIVLRFSLGLVCAQTWSGMYCTWASLKQGQIRVAGLDWTKACPSFQSAKLYSLLQLIRVIEYAELPRHHSLGTLTWQGLPSMSLSCCQLSPRPSGICHLRSSLKLLNFLLGSRLDMPNHSFF
jgi:hypothetical protein